MAKGKKEEVVTETPETEVSEKDLAIRAAFDDNSGAEEEVVKMAMLHAGCQIKAVTRVFNQFMIDSGLMASKEEKDSALDAICTDVDLTEEDNFNEAVTAVVEKVTGATEASAATLIRAWAKANEVEFYKKPAGASRQSGFRFKFYAALKANPAMTSAEAKAFGDAEGSENDKKAFSHYQAIRELVNASSGNVAEATA